MKNTGKMPSKTSGRRAFLKNGMVAAGVATLSSGLAARELTNLDPDPDNSGSLPRGDAAILRFLQALETIEADLWQQYAELGGATNQGVSPIDLGFTTGLAPLYITALEQLDSDMPQYIADNTDDEFSHAAFLKAYLQFKRADTVDLHKEFDNIAPSTVSGVPQNPRLTNL